MFSPDRRPSLTRSRVHTLVHRSVLASVLFGSALLVALLAIGCSTEKDAPAPEPPPQREPLPDPAEPPENELLIVFLGDSLTAGYGLDEDDAFPMLVERALRDAGYSVRVINGGVSGDTTAGGLRRLPWLLRQDPDVMMVALGGNDGLRGFDLEASEENLRLILEQAQAADVEVLLAGMLMPPNYGEDYADRFAGMYPRLADDFEVALLPFLLEGVAGDPELNQPDGIHPTPEGQKKVAETVTEAIQPLLDKVKAKQAAEAPTDVLP